MPRGTLRERVSRAAAADGPIVVDIGTSTLTGIRRSARPHLQVAPALAHPTMETLALSSEDCAAFGSDCARAGYLFESASSRASVTDAFGVEWLRFDAALTPVRHPLEHASWREIANYPRPSWPTLVQAPLSGRDRHLVVADAPCSGLLDLSFLLRNPWKFLDDTSSNDRCVPALLDWCLETIIEAYALMLERLPVVPDIIVYGDDLGFQQSMFLSTPEFQRLVLPRLRVLISRLRQLTPAAVCFHSCGAIRPILPAICNLDVEVINLDCSARDMECRALRRELPRQMILHGCNPIAELGRAVRCRNLASVATLTSEIVDSFPLIAAPVDSLSTSIEVDNVQLAARFLRELSPNGLGAISRIGPVRSILDAAVQRARAAELPSPTGHPPEAVETSIMCSTDASTSLHTRHQVLNTLHR